MLVNTEGAIRKLVSCGKRSGEKRADITDSLRLGFLYILPLIVCGLLGTTADDDYCFKILFEHDLDLLQHAPDLT
jgi:hypothetical protein